MLLIPTVQLLTKLMGRPPTAAKNTNPRSGRTIPWPLN